MLKLKAIQKVAFVTAILVIGFGIVGSIIRTTPSTIANRNILLADVVPRSFDVQIASMGELEASRSHIIASSIKGDLGKLIYLIPEGSKVSAGDILIKMDPTPFEEVISALQEKIRAKETTLETLNKSLEWEKQQVYHDLKASEFDVETAELELNRVINGDGPQEIAKLNAAVQKTHAQFTELEGYMHDLKALEEQGFLNPSEIKQAQRKLDEEKEAYEGAKLQYDSYVMYVHPMNVKKAETALKRALNKKEETVRSGEFRIGKESAHFALAQHELNDLIKNLRNAKYELSMTEVKAPTPGMVVHRDEYRSGLRRKPRIGDILIKNQPLLDLPDLDSMIVKTRVREVDLCKIQIGHPVTLKVDAYPNLILSGYVSSIGVLALVDPAHMGEEKYFDVVVSLNSGDLKLRPGMTTRLIIHAAHVSEAISVPVHAIFEYAKQTYCYVLDQNGFIVNPVKVGHCNDEWVEISTGLEVGQQVSLTYPTAEKISDPHEILRKNNG
jgi:HlyD family secretion protein